MDLGLKGRVAIVAASSAGLGKAVAMGLAKESHMEVNLERVKSMLDGIGIVAHPANGSNLVFAVEVGSKPLLVSVSIGASVLQFRTVGMLLAPAASYRAVLLDALLDTCLRYKVLKITFDPDDGEVVGYVDLFLAGAELTERQLQRCLATIGFFPAIRDR